MYKRVLLKLSGEILGGPEGKGLEPEYLRKYAREIADAAKAGLQIGVVNGGGNIFRGLCTVGRINHAGAACSGSKHARRQPDADQLFQFH